MIVRGVAGATSRISSACARMSRRRSGISSPSVSSSATLRYRSLAR